MLRCECALNRIDAVRDLIDCFRSVGKLFRQHTAVVALDKDGCGKIDLFRKRRKNAVGEKQKNNAGDRTFGDCEKGFQRRINERADGDTAQKADGGNILVFSRKLAAQKSRKGVADTKKSYLTAQSRAKTDADSTKGSAVSAFKSAERQGQKRKNHSDNREIEQGIFIERHEEYSARHECDYKIACREPCKLFFAEDQRASLDKNVCADKAQH